MKKIIFVFILLMQCVSLFSEDYIFENKDYIYIADEYYRFNDGFFEHYTFDDSIDKFFDWKKESYPYEIKKEGAYLVANVQKESGIDKIYIFCADEKHLIMYDSERKKVIDTSLRIGPLDEPWIWSGIDYKATSYFSETLNGKLVEYIPENLDIYKLDSSWVEGAKGYGKGESVSFDNRGSRRIYIINGFFSPDKPQLFYDNNRIKTLKINCYKDGTYCRTIFKKLKDTGEMQVIEFSERYTSFDFIIDDVYHGLKYDDTALTGIFIDGLDLLKKD